MLVPVLAVRTERGGLSRSKEKLIRVEALRVIKRQAGEAFLLRGHSIFGTHTTTETFHHLIYRDSLPKNQLRLLLSGSLLILTFTQASINPASGSIWLTS